MVLIGAALAGHPEVLARFGRTLSRTGFMESTPGFEISGTIVSGHPHHFGVHYPSFGGSHSICHSWLAPSQRNGNLQQASIEL
eukprot:scaffold13456_cov48-Attheya_sp.AAC.2